MDSLRASYAAINALGKCARWDKALDLLVEMQAKGIPPDVVSYNTAMKACSDCRQWEKAVDLLAKMQAKGISPNVVSYNSAVKAYGNGAQWQKTLHLFGRDAGKMYPSGRGELHLGHEGMRGLRVVGEDFGSIR